MSRDEIHAALLAAARALQRDGVSGSALAALFEALEAADAEMPIVGPERAPAAGLSCYRTQQTPHAENAAGAEVATAALSRLDVAPQLPLCTAEGCGRVADVGLTCFHHSPAAQVPPLWQRVRDAADGGGDDE